MKILGVKTTHDGAIALLDNAKLRFSIEQEKDSHARNSSLSMAAVMKSLERMDDFPDVIAVGGWRDFAAGYSGIDRVQHGRRRFLGREVECFSSSHERSHLFCAYAMSPFKAKQPCYVLTWEGELGSFYRIGESMEITAFPPVLFSPAPRYTYLYYLAKKTPAPVPKWFETHDMAGKLMALAAGGRNAPCTADEQRIVDYLLSPDVREPGQIVSQLPSDKAALPFATPFRDIGEQSQACMDAALKLSEALFDVFHRFAAAHLKERLPLLVNGGCGLNCYWNSKWKDSGLFSDVFVPPCPNDSGSAIGTAADAQHFYTGNPKISWSVYAGEEFLDDAPAPQGWTPAKLNLERVAAYLRAGGVVAWVQGKYEIGPRALGNRSLLAAPFSAAMTAELNRIKQREAYRPIAPVCLEEDVGEHFHWTGPSPYMLYFQKVKNPTLHAVTHVDGSARVQTVARKQNPALHDLLRAFKRIAGVGVLCNTSLNFKGKGFINKASDLFGYAAETGIGLMVVNGRMLERSSIGAERAPQKQPAGASAVREALRVS